MKKRINILLLLAVALFSIWCTGNLMRKNDQASILAGANDIATGRMRDPVVYYQFDKTYVLYGVCAAVLKAARGLPPVASANVGLALIFWSALSVFVVRFRRVLDPLVLLCFLSAPAVLLNTLYVNSSVLSSAFLLLSAVFLLKEGPRGGWTAALFFFLAVGSRADVILLLPLLLWLIIPFPMVKKFLSDFPNLWGKGGALRRDCRDGALTKEEALDSDVVGSKPWKLILAGVMALLVGRFICHGGGVALDPIFNWKMVAGYTVFGFGAAGLLFVLYAVSLIKPVFKGRSVFEKLYCLAGLAAFLLPVLFFIPQLHAPRYFWRGCEAVLLLAVSSRLPVWNSRSVKILIAALALIPLGFGVQMLSPVCPRVAVLTPTLFPSGDGFYPMGGTVPFMIRMRAADRTPLDHNQRVWSAVHSARFDFASDGTMDVLQTPMAGYFMLEASLRGGVALSLPFDRLAGRPFYADSRSLMRDDPKTPLSSVQKILSLPSHFVSPVFSGAGVLRLGEGDDLWGRQTQLLNRLFCGNEYRILSSDASPESGGWIVRFSSVPFDDGERDAESSLYYSIKPGPLPDGGSIAQAVLPGWMSLQAFGDSQ